ncbi:apoptotic protease-activating factor 1 isoform X2 [Linepithema humile]|uniref:apoptotic protease-activating factor 1 isoform X2 n=1 Tax=Linepithema humile TaxID=83485 RepID=UPI00351F2A1F
MEKSHKDILYHLRSNIIDDVDIDNDIIQPLTSEYILTQENIKYIYSGATKQERAGILLNILPDCGSNAFDVFHQSLKHHYDWISDEIDRMLGNYEIETNGEIDYYDGPSNIPPLSPLTVTREEKLKEALQQLNPTEYVALHGMKGFGKSCLTASTLKDVKLRKILFSNKVYWIKFACDHSVDEEILIQLNTLYHYVKNLEIQLELFTPLGKDSLIRFLKHHFNKLDNRNALLILDDVFDEKIINTFDFECKTLVLTADIDVLRGRMPKVIKINDGFTEPETLGLFAKVLKVEVEELPTEAKKIHEECKGMPLLIAMFAAHFEEFKDDMKIRNTRWKYYLQSLKKKDATNKVMKEFLKKQEIIFDMCIEQLQPDLKERYKSLAIFSEDVNITPKTLEILWGQDIFQVEELMLDLCHKSLAAKKWNKDLRSYIYGVHDLLLCHLRKKLTPDELTKMHRSIVEKYRKCCDNNFSKLPDDNYIYSYIGYHLEQSKYFSQFPQLYFDFDFIQAKIMHVGLSDLLLDLKKYREYITSNNDENETKVSDIERFLQEQASVIIEHKRKNCLDIIQIAMNHSYQGYVAQKAKYLATSREMYLYLSHDKKLKHIDIPLTEEISTSICTSSFTDDPNLILTGNVSGKIYLWNCESKQPKIFNGHSEESSIKKVIVSTNGDCFLALSSIGIIKLFLLLNDEVEQNHVHVDSPRQKQSCWSGLFGNISDKDDSLIEFSIKNEIILDMAFGYEDKYVAACSNKTVKIWNRRGETVFDITDSKYESIIKIAFTAKASLLHVMDESRGAFDLYSNGGNDCSIYEYLACYNLQLQEEKVIFFNHVPNFPNSLMIVTEKRAMYVKWWLNDERDYGVHSVHSFDKQLRAFVEDDAVTYICAAVTYDGKYIVLADSAGFINVWNTYSGYQPVATYKRRVTSLDTYWLRSDGYHIICGNGDRLLYRWKLPVESDKLPRKYLFDAVVKPYNELDTIVKESQAKKIVVSYGKRTIESESTEGKILSLQLFPDGNKVAYVTEKHAVMLFDIINRKLDVIMKLNEPIRFLQIININNCDTVICEWTDGKLTVWQELEQFEIIIGGRIAFIHKLNDNHVITITTNGIIKIWHTVHKYWKMTNYIWLQPPSSITFSCLNYNKTYLAVLKNLQQLDIYLFYKTPEHNLQLRRVPYFVHTFAQKTTCCDVSQNNQYIAVGFETGKISIIDLFTQTEITQLSFHSNPIRQLSWAPTTADASILLSLTDDELIWWNITLSKNNVKRRSRMGISHSTSTPSLSMNTSLNVQLPNSRSDNGVSNLQNNDESSESIANDVNDVSKYWKNKIVRDSEIPGLLAVIELPPSRNAKICISSDFTKFVMADMYGSVSTFKLINYKTG